METVVKLSCNLRGLKRSKSWRKNLSGFFELDNGTQLSDSQVRHIVEYGIKNGYETDSNLQKQRKWYCDTLAYYTRK